MNTHGPVLVQLDWRIMFVHELFLSRSNSCGFLGVLQELGTQDFMTPKEALVDSHLMGSQHQGGGIHGGWGTRGGGPSHNNNELGETPQAPTPPSCPRKKLPPVPGFYMGNKRPEFSPAQSASPPGKKPRGMFTDVDTGSQVSL